MAHIAIPLPFTPVPITGQTFAVLLSGAVLGARLGTASMLLYITEGAVGLPVFAAAKGPTTYGYLAGFVAAALIVGWLGDIGLAQHLPRVPDRDPAGGKAAAECLPAMRSDLLSQPQGGGVGADRGRRARLARASRHRTGPRPVGDARWLRRLGRAPAGRADPGMHGR